MLILVIPRSPKTHSQAFALITCGFYSYHKFGYHVYSNHLPNFRTSSNRFSSPYKTVYPIRNQMKPSNPVIHCCTHEIQIRLPVLMHSNGKTAKIIRQKNVKEISYSSTDHFTTTYPLTLTDTFSIQSQQLFPYNIPTTRFLTKIISKLVTVLYEECSYQWHNKKLLLPTPGCEKVPSRSDSQITIRRSTTCDTAHHNSTSYF